MDHDTDDEREEQITKLLEDRACLTTRLCESPYDLIVYLERAGVHSDLGYPDLAAGDSYRALLLCDAIRNEEEYGEEAQEALEKQAQDGLPHVLSRYNRHGNLLASELQTIDLEDQPRSVSEMIHLASIRCYRTLAVSLLLCGCLKSAYEFCSRGLQNEPQDRDLQQAHGYIMNIAKQKLGVEAVDVTQLPEEGLVRREIYPWNTHEPDRFSNETLSFLNEELRAIGAKCEVKAVDLPVLSDNASTSSSGDHVSHQLGLFATEDLEPGATVLEERSLLAANNRLKEDLCDACSTRFPPLDSPNSTVISCSECDDITFCSPNCYELAHDTYHPAVCDKDIDAVAKDPKPEERTTALYILLLTRALAMAQTQEIHPLELKEIKYIYGDFLPSARNAIPLRPASPPPPIWTLPFSFNTNIAAPIHILEKMDVDIYADLETYDLWVLNTCYAKFRGTASARVNHKTGHPEVAAVHPLWCLANHDCDPNVQWEWNAKMRLWVRDERVMKSSGEVSRGGIKKGEEIFNHYCDIELPVKERREWARGPLGGLCMCGRCVREAADLERTSSNGVNGVNGVNGLALEASAGTEALDHDIVMGMD